MGFRALSVWGVFVTVLLSSVGRTEPPKEEAKREARVKTTTVGVSPSREQEGIVAKIDADGLTLVDLRKFGEQPVEYLFLPIDHLRAGKVLPDASPRSAYRWEDVKSGDTVELRVAQDHIDKQMYCLEISIKRRPKGPLPASQVEDPHFPGLRLMNDIENGLDVSDEEIMKICPPRKEVRDKRGDLIQAASPGGLNKEWQAKLDATRAKKKEAELKAPTPEKK